MSHKHYLQQGNWRIFSIAWAHKIGLNETLVLMDLLDARDQFGQEFFCTFDRLCYNTTLSEHLVNKALKSLRELGLISYKRKGMPPRNFYKIIDENIDDTAKIAIKESDERHRIIRERSLNTLGNVTKVDQEHIKNVEKESKKESEKPESEDSLSNSKTSLFPAGLKKFSYNQVVEIIEFWNSKNLIPATRINLDKLQNYYLHCFLQLEKWNYSIEEIKIAIKHRELIVNDLTWKYGGDKKMPIHKFLGGKQHRIKDYQNDGTQWVNYKNYANIDDNELPDGALDEIRREEMIKEIAENRALAIYIEKNFVFGGLKENRDFHKTFAGSRPLKDKMEGWRKWTRLEWIKILEFLEDSITEEEFVQMLINNIKVFEFIYNPIKNYNLINTPNEEEYMELGFFG